MGPLPEDRLEANGWPFKNTGLDYFGPLMVMVCRRGQVYKLRSDNGKNFVGADREARRFGDVFEPKRIQGELSGRGIEWKRMVRGSCVTH